MNALAPWENIALIIIMAAVLFFFLPGIKQTLQASKEAKSDWPSLIFPLILVVLFVIALVAW